MNKQTTALYQEKHFMHMRDVDAYIEKQAGSAAYLVNEFAKYALNTPINHLFQFWSQCHERQYAQLTERLGHDVEIPTESFYFDSMYADVLPKDTCQKAIIHTVSYVRGAMRYDTLYKATGERIWKDLFNDAALNSIEGDKFCRLDCGDDIFEWNIYYILRCEGELMKKIDNRAKLTCIRSVKL